MYVTKKRPLLTSFCLIYTAFISSWFVLWLFAGDKFWWMMALNRVGPYLFLPILIIIPITWVVKKPKLGLLLLPTLLIFSVLYWPYITPQFVSSPQSADLRVMTFNVLHSNKNFAGTANIILNQSPDLVALQEVQPEMMTFLQASLESSYPYSFMGIENDWGTTAIFSRYPIIEKASLDFINDRPVTIVTVQVESEVITFAAVHLRPYVLDFTPIPDMPGVIKQRTQEQNRQTELLLETLETYGDLAIIACDCNSMELSSSYRILKKSMKSASREIGWQIGNQAIGTSPDLNLRHIDFVFYQGNIEPTTTFLVDDMGGSDHKPLVVDFALSDGSK